MVVTVITKIGGRDGEITVAVVEGILTDAQQQQWREAHGISSEAAELAEADEMYFRTVEVGANTLEPSAVQLLDVDGSRRLTLWVRLLGFAAGQTAFVVNNGVELAGPQFREASNVVDRFSVNGRLKLLEVVKKCGVVKLSNAYSAEDWLTVTVMEFVEMVTDLDGLWSLCVNAAFERRLNEVG